MGSDLRVRFELNELLSTSLNEEHYRKIKQEFPAFAPYDEDFDNLLYFLENVEKCISMTDLSRLISLLNKIGLDEAAKRIAATQKVPEEKYEGLKNEIERVFSSRQYRKKYMGPFKNKIIDHYELKSEDVEHCTMRDIIEDLEEQGLLSRSSSDILKLKQVFMTCGCNEVVNCIINSLEDKTAVEETPMDTTDARAVNAPQQHTHPSGNRIPQGIQEQNPGSSEATTGGGDQSGIHTGQAPTTGVSPTKGYDSSERATFQTANTGASPNAGQHVGSGVHQTAKPQPHSQARPQAHSQEHSHGTMFSSSHVGTNINIGPGTHIQSFNISSSIPGHGNQGQFHYVPGGYGQGQGNSYPGPGIYGQSQGNPGQDLYFPTQNVPKPPGYLPDQALMHICREVGGNWRMLGLNLGLSWSELERIHSNSRKVEDAIMEMLMQWRSRQPRALNQLDKMCQALKAHQNVRLAEELRAMMKNQL